MYPAASSDSILCTDCRMLNPRGNDYASFGRLTDSSIRDGCMLPRNRQPAGILPKIIRGGRGSEAGIRASLLCVEPTLVTG